MVLTPAARRLVLTLHVVSAVGWLGAVVVSLAFAAAALLSDDEALVRSLYVALEWSGRLVLMPFSLATLATGLVISLGTHWGLLRHYWVVIKLSLTLVSIAILLAYTGTLAQLGALARDDATPIADLRDPSPLLHAALALIGLVVAVVLSIYKPRGLTRYGQRKRRAGPSSSEADVRGQRRDHAGTMGRPARTSH